MLWGQKIKSNKVKDLTINAATVLMSIHDVLMNQGEQRFWDYLTCLKHRRFLYKGDQHPSQSNLAYLKFVREADWYIIDLDNIKPFDEEVQHYRLILLK